MNMKLFEFSN